MIAYLATLDVPGELVRHLGRLLVAERRARGTWAGTPPLDLLLPGVARARMVTSRRPPCPRPGSPACTFMVLVAGRMEDGGAMTCSKPYVIRVFLLLRRRGLALFVRVGGVFALDGGPSAVAGA